MTYAPPSGFAETLPTTADGPIRVRFHARSDCPRVRGRQEDLRLVDRPYSAVRCPLCAPDTGSRPTGR